MLYMTDKALWLIKSIVELSDVRDINLQAITEWEIYVVAPIHRLYSIDFCSL